MSHDLNLDVILTRSEDTYSWIADLQGLPPQVREHFNYDVPALISAVKRLAGEVPTPAVAEVVEAAIQYWLHGDTSVDYHNDLGDAVDRLLRERAETPETRPPLARAAGIPVRNPLTDKIAQAIGDPGSILARGEDETITRWSTRAVKAVLDAEDRAADAADRAHVNKLLAETGMAGMDIHDGSARLKLVLAHELATKMTLSFKTILDAQPGAENYVEQEIFERNGGNRYVFIVCKPTGKTPHQLRREAEGERDALRAELASALQELEQLRAEAVTTR